MPFGTGQGYNQPDADAGREVTIELEGVVRSTRAWAMNDVNEAAAAPRPSAGRVTKAEESLIASGAEGELQVARQLVVGEPKDRIAR